MKRYMDFIERANPEHLRRNQRRHELRRLACAAIRTRRRDLIATAYWAIVARDMKEMATALERRTDAEKYEALYEKIAAAYRTAYIHPDGSVTGDTQTAYVATLYSGIAPETLRAPMTARLVKDIEAHGNHLTTGFLGTPFLMFVLDDNGRADVAYQLLLQDTYPSWGYMVAKGATTMVGALERRHRRPGDELLQPLRVRLGNGVGVSSRRRHRYRRVRPGISPPGDHTPFRFPPAAGPCGVRLSLRNSHDGLEQCDAHIHFDHTAEFHCDDRAAAWPIRAGGQWQARLHGAVIGGV